ncbi:GFA family protein [Jinshanibacter sp. LJY008]|uniref:GFA family protein n=1 Tax=Limnobaculum eriocheiris TaxID=2897391 RepID=A0A9X1MWX1_9GAMM|nr:GFA family protein [Limnobaculum eriocheiris]MCD1125670.1 GFA family protein [Limnobaculum eriocheiris]
MLKGSCLCGAVTYQLDEPINQLFFCHCSKCRKATGTAFNSAALIHSDKFTLLTGKASLKSFSSTPGVHRIFCGECGSPLYSARDNQPEAYRLRIGTLDTHINPAEKMHIFTASKAEWEDLCDDNPKFEERP